MDKKEIIVKDLQTIFDKLKAEGKEFSFIGLAPIDERFYRLRVKADWLNEMKRWQASDFMAGMFFYLRKDGIISDDTFDAILVIDILAPDAEDTESIPWEFFRLSYAERQRLRKLLFSEIIPVQSTGPVISYKYEFKPSR